MHCPNCKSTEVKMVGSVANPSWQCQRCGSTEAPRHAYDKPVEDRKGRRVDEVLQTYTGGGTVTANKIAGAPTLTAEQWYGYDPGADCYKLPEGVWLHTDGRYMAECKSCGDDYEVPCDLSEFDRDMSYCGKDPRCCP